MHACNPSGQVLIPKIEISLRQYDWSVVSSSRLLPLHSRKRTETIYLSNLITVQYLPAQSNRWHSMHEITMPCICIIVVLHIARKRTPPHSIPPSSHLSLKNPSSITWTPQPPKLRLQVLLQFNAHGKKGRPRLQVSLGARIACVASPSGSLVLVYFCRDMNAFGAFPFALIEL